MARPFGWLQPDDSPYNWQQLKHLTCERPDTRTTVRHRMKVERNKMTSKLYKFSGIVLCMLMLGVLGCKPKPVAGPNGEPKTSEGPMLAPPQQPEPAKPQAARGDTSDHKIKASLALLSTEDRALAEKQKICPVSGEPLGTMGAPKKINVAGRDVFICCPGCEEDLTSHPDKYLAKLDQQPAK